MSDDLAKRLRYCSEEQNGCGMCALSSDCVLRVGLLTQAADAIEELSRKYESVAASLTESVKLVDKLHKRIEKLSKRVPPVPHGRLIDADALLDDLLFPSKQFEQGMRELIGDAPTVAPAEETLKEATNDQNNS